MSVHNALRMEVEIWMRMMRSSMRKCPLISRALSL